MPQFFPNAQPIPWVYETLWSAQNVGQFAYECSVYKQVLCPCGSTPDSRSNINCQACFGTGYLYPNPPIKSLMLVSDVSQSLDLEQYGLMQPGELMAVTKPGSVHLDDFDIVILPWKVGEPAFSDLITRGTGATDSTQYVMERVNGAFTVNYKTGISTQFLPNIDFTYSGKTITWIRNAPEAGQVYTIHYDARYEWIAFSSLSPVVAFGQDLGQVAHLRKRHIVLKNVPSLLEA